MSEYPIERFLEEHPAEELRFSELRGQKIFIVTADQVVVFVELNGIRKAVTFPRRPQQR